MSAIKDISGQRFGRLRVIALGDSINGRQHWMSRCDCGSVKQVSGKSLRAGLVLSCGCLLAEKRLTRFTVHGKYGTPEYRVWGWMIQRCTNPKTHNFKNYGGRGIAVCDAWRKFENFIADMGERPSSRHSIERIDVNGNYEPGNCKWATASEQSRNRRPYFGVTFEPLRNRNGSFRAKSNPR